MKNKSEQLDVEKYKAELASLRRAAVQLNDLRKWLLNISLASLAFAFTVMLQTKEDGIASYPTLAGFTIAFLILSVAGGIVIRGKNELENFLLDSKSFFPMLSVLRDMLRTSHEVTETDKAWMVKYLDKAVSFSENEISGKDSKPFSPYFDIVLIIIEFILLVFGVGCLCVYLWRFLFA